MMADELLNAQDLITAKKHDTFHSEVITGKVGGLSTGANIDYATNAVTGQAQKTLPATIDGLDWSYAGKFADGVTFTKKSDFAIDANGTQWIYTGSLPFSATAGTVPSEPTYQVVHVKSASAISNANGGSVQDFIDDLASPSSILLVGGKKASDLGNVNGNDGISHFSIGAIPQCNASGVFELIDNSSHNPMNVSGVSQPDQYTIRITYNQEAAKINTFIAAPDAELAPFGLVCGGDVGTSFANIQCYAPLEFLADNNDPNPSINLNALWAPSLVSGSITVTRLSDSTLRVTHPPVTTNAPPVVSPVNSANSSRFVVSFGETVTDVVCVANAKGYVGYSGSVWEQFFSDNVTPPIMTWTVNNTLRVDHGVTYGGSGVPQVTGQGGVLIPSVVEYGATYFEVAFFDYAGVKILSQSVDMKFWYVVDGLTLPSKWPIGNLVSVKRGLCHVPSYNFKGVTGNNLWVYGDFEKFN